MAPRPVTIIKQVFNFGAGSVYQAATSTAPPPAATPPAPPPTAAPPAPAARGRRRRLPALPPPPDPPAPPAPPAKRPIGAVDEDLVDETKPKRKRKKKAATAEEKADRVRAHEARQEEARRRRRERFEAGDTTLGTFAREKEEKRVKMEQEAAAVTPPAGTTALGLAVVATSEPSPCCVLVLWCGLLGRVLAGGV